MKMDNMSLIWSVQWHWFYLKGPLQLFPWNHSQLFTLFHVFFFTFYFHPLPCFIFCHFSSLAFLLINWKHFFFYKPKHLECGGWREIPCIIFSFTTKWTWFWCLTLTLQPASLKAQVTDTEGQCSLMCPSTSSRGIFAGSHLLGHCTGNLGHWYWCVCNKHK